MYLLQIAVGIVISILVIIALLLVGGILGLIGFGIYLASKIVLIFYIAVFGLVFIIACLIVGGVINTFNSAVVTLTYLELTKKT